MRYKALVVILIALAIATALYAGYWYYAAELVQRSLLDWSAARRSDGFTIGWDRTEVGGFPFTLRVTIEKPIFGQSRIEPGYEARGELLVGEARPWALGQWHITASQGGTLAIQPGPERPAINLAAASLDGTVMPRQDGDAAMNAGADVMLAADRLTVDGQTPLAIAHGVVRARIPGGAVATHLQTWLSASFALDEVALPVTVSPLGNTVERIAATLAIKGTIPGGPRRQALAAWRDDGGTLELQSFALVWGKLALDAKGTVALDAALQPLGALTATIRGYGQIIDALVTAGSLKAGDAALVNLGLGLLAKPAPDGQYQLDAPLTLQNGQAYLGPVRLARMPSFVWE
jgi:hypothetical protein